MNYWAVRTAQGLVGPEGNCPSIFWIFQICGRRLGGGEGQIMLTIKLLGTPDFQTFLRPSIKYVWYIFLIYKVEKIWEDGSDSISSSSPWVKIQIMGGKVCLRCKGKTLLGVVNKLLRTKSIFCLHIGPIFHISLIYAFIRCPQSLPT